MASLTVENFPPDLHRRLNQRAAAHGRSLTDEILAILHAAVPPLGTDIAALQASARRAREGVTAQLTDAFLDEARRRGRP